MIKQASAVALSLFLILVSVASTSFAALPKKVKVAFVAGYTGADPNTARELDRGLESFLKYNKEAREQLDVVKFDNKGSVLGTVKVMNQIEQSGIKLVIGIARSDEALAAAKEAARTKTLFITPFATNPLVSEQGEATFQVCFTDAFQGKAIARLLVKELKSKKALLLVNTESIYSTGLATSIRQTLVESSMSSLQLFDLSYTDKELNLESAMNLVRAEKPDVIIIPDHITRAALIAKSLQKVDSKIKFIGGDGFGGKKVLSGVFGDTPAIELLFTTHWHQSLPGEINRAFVSSYASVAKEQEPTTGAAMTFDAFKVLWDSLKANRMNGGPAEIASEIQKSTFKLTTGKLSFQKSKDAPTKKSAVVMQLKNGEYSVFKSIEP